MEKDQVLYSLNVEDAQNVAVQTIHRTLTDEELRQLQRRLGNHLPNWFDLLEMAIDDVVNQTT